jgi:hypothetical protein
MGKAKTITMNLAELVQKVETGEITLFGNQEHMEEQSLNALKRLHRGNPGFACKNCGQWFKPQPTQWIFHELCDPCFAVFDRQKMLGRFSILEKKPIGLSCMKGNFHVQFLGEGAVVKPPPYPTGTSVLIPTG